MSRIYFFGIAAVLYLAFDLYIYQAIRVLISDYEVLTRRLVSVAYFGVSLVLFLGIIFYEQLDPKQFQNLRLFITTAFFITLIGKLISAIFLVADDFRRLVTYVMNLMPSRAETPKDLSRSEFLSKSAIIAGTVPIAVFSFGIVSGAHDYRIRKRQIVSPNVPKAFDGLR
ncbi:MAG: metallophosphoesterase, partial [Marinoscillum sp.]